MKHRKTRATWSSCLPPAVLAPAVSGALVLRVQCAAHASAELVKEAPQVILTQRLLTTHGQTLFYVLMGEIPIGSTVASDTLLSKNRK